MTAGASGLILVVESDRILAAKIVRHLHQADFEVDGPHRSAPEAMVALANHFPDGAVIDTDVNGLLADDLDLYGIPYVRTSAYADDVAGRLATALRQSVH